MNDANQRIRCFVAIPFNDEYDDTYSLGIKGACDEVNAECIRLDKMYFQGMIQEKIFEEICNADIIIAEITDHNPNVFLEIGFALAKGKTIILLQKEGTKKAFDVSSFQIIFYSKIGILKKDLRKIITHYAEQMPSKEILTSNLSYSINSQPLLVDRVGKINVKIENHNDTRYPFLCDLFVKISNDGENSADLSNTCLKVILPNCFQHSLYGMHDILSFEDPTNSSTKHSSFTINAKDKLLPGQDIIKRLSFQTTTDPRTVSADGKFKVSSSFGKSEIDFALNYDVVLNREAS